jgi:FtsP/CotA-like multicopper oxidase with cupredoxin domain
MIPVEPEQSVLLRMIAAASATNLYVDTGALEAEILGVDGKAVRSIKGNFFQLGTAQRLDLRAIIPKEGGAFPILAQGEGTKLLCGVVLITKGHRLRCSPAQPLPPLWRSTTPRKRGYWPSTRFQTVSPTARFPQRLAETWQLIWKINGEAYPNRDSLDVRNGERVGIVFTNATSMGHPMHLHGHDFQVVEVDGEKLSGALRDTILVP